MNPLSTRCLTQGAAALDPLTYDVVGLAAALGCSERHVWRLYAGNMLPAAVRIGRLVRWSRKSIDRWLADGCPPPPKKSAR